MQPLSNSHAGPNCIIAYAQNLTAIKGKTGIAKNLLFCGLLACHDHRGIELCCLSLLLPKVLQEREVVAQHSVILIMPGSCSRPRQHMIPN